MSGGAFDYRDSVLTDLKDMVAREICYMEYGSNYTEHQYKDKTFKYMKAIVRDLERLSKVIHSLDWFVSGDTIEEKFISDYEAIYDESKK